VRETAAFPAATDDRGEPCADTAFNNEEDPLKFTGRFGDSFATLSRCGADLHRNFAASPLNPKR
jgi:hypothetical protein